MRFAMLFAASLIVSGCGGNLDIDKAPSNNANNANNANNVNNTSTNNVNNTSTNNANNTSTNNTNNTSTNNGTTNNVTVNNIDDPVYENPCTSGPLGAPIANCSPTPFPTTGDPREDCVRRINQFRHECQCLPPLQRWTEGESCADQQALYDSQGNGAHAGFQDSVCSPRGNAQNECPSWGDWGRVNGQCLQMMWDEGPGEPFSAHGHYINMSSNNYSMVACGEGGGWFVQNFR